MSSLSSKLPPEWISLPGLTEYNDALELMHKRVQDIIEGSKNETVFLVEHLDVYTAGTSYKDDELINCKGIPVIYTGRGGKFTYHGPGQRVIYPILNLEGNNRSKDLRLYVRLLEQLIINTLKEIGVKAYTLDKKIGVWTNIDNNIPAKIGAIGVRVKKYVTYHGAAINITTDLNKYKGIIPCGINDYPVTSLASIGIDISMEDFDYLLKQEFNKLF